MPRCVTSKSQQHPSKNISIADPEHELLDGPMANIYQRLTLARTHLSLNQCAWLNELAAHDMPYVKGWALGAWCRRGGTTAAEEPASPSASSSLPFLSTASSSSLASSSSTATTHTPPGIICGGIGPLRWPLAYFSMTWTTKATDRMVIELSLSCPHLVRLGVTRSNMIPT